MPTHSVFFGSARVVHAIGSEGIIRVCTDSHKMDEQVMVGERRRGERQAYSTVLPQSEAPGCESERRWSE
eukprot:s135_g5.t1